MRKILWVTAAAVIVYGSVGCSSSESAPSAATPTFSPAAGTYAAPQSVTLSCATPGATIYYTVDGSAPTTSSTVYASPITVSATMTVKAIAFASGFTESEIATGVYVVNCASNDFDGCYVGDACHWGYEDAYCGWFGSACLACPSECYCVWGFCWDKVTGQPCTAPYAK